MIQSSNSLIGRSLVSGTIAGLTTATAAALAGRYETASFAAPLNATSHIVWGDKAAWQNRPSMKYTMTGFLLNHASAIFWAGFYEKWFAPRPGETNVSPLRPVIGALVVTAGAYVTDYYLVPERLTPGFEKRLSNRSLAAVFGALALGLAISGFVGRRQAEQGAEYSLPR